MSNKTDKIAGNGPGRKIHLNVKDMLGASDNIPHIKSLQRKIKGPKDASKFAGFRGELIIGRNMTTHQQILPNGQIQYVSKLGEVLFREENIVPIGAYQFVFSQLLNIPFDTRSPLRVGHLNDEAPQMRIGVPRHMYRNDRFTHESTNTDPLSSEHLPNNGPVGMSAMTSLCGFMIGAGGAREDNITAISPDYKRRSLYLPIPFQMIAPADQQELPPDKYYGRFRNQAGIESYYIKKFDDPAPRIVHAWVTDTSDLFNPDLVDESVFAATSHYPIESYIEMNLSLSNNDGRAFFTAQDETPRINELGLVGGWFNADRGDYEHLVLITHFTRPSIVLGPADSVDIIYRLYAR